MLWTSRFLVQSALPVRLVQSDVDVTGNINLSCPLWHIQAWVMIGKHEMKEQGKLGVDLATAVWPWILTGSLGHRGSFLAEAGGLYGSPGSLYGRQSRRAAYHSPGRGGPLGTVRLLPWFTHLKLQSRLTDKWLSAKNNPRPRLHTNGHPSAPCSWWEITKLNEKSTDG